MPHLRFYAVDEDHRAVLEQVFAVGDFDVYDRYSEPDVPIRRYRDAAEVPASPTGTLLMLHVRDAGGTPVLDAPPRHGVTAITGWGLIQLDLGVFFRGRELRWSTTNHNTTRTAATWAATFPDGESQGAWDFDGISRASGRLNRRIRALAVDRIGAHPVLPAASVLIDRHGLTHVYGTGIHDRPPPG